MAVLDKSISDSRTAWRPKFVSNAEPMRGAFFWLSAFYVVYCARPEDWIPGLKYIPLAKISGLFALLALVFSGGRSKRTLRDLPREAYCLLALIGCLAIAGALSPVWKGGALIRTAEFSKILIAWVLTFIVISNFERLRRIIYIQSASVAAIVVLSLLKGRDHPRLEGVIGGIYSNPNDLAFAIVLSLPFCVAFFLNTKNLLRKAAWIAVMLAMCTALFLTASRGGFITQLIAAAALVALVVGVAAGGRLKDRFSAISGEDLNDQVDVSAHGSFEQRRELMGRSVEGIASYPFGIGLGNFPNYSGTWRQVHVAYLQIAVEGGIAACICYLLFFAQGFANLRQLRRIGGEDEETILFAGALHSSLIGFVVGALFAPEAYQFFPYFAVAYTSVLLAIAREKAQERSVVADSPVRPSWKRKLVRAGDMTSVG
jgi:hypothetical protein